MDARRLSYWELELPAANPHAGPLPDRVDVLIVGAGLMGRWLAYFLARRNPAPRVLVIERDGFGFGASTRNAGFLTCGQVSEMLADAQHAGADAVIENFLQRRRGIEIVRREFPELDVDPCGSFDYDELTGRKRELAKALNDAAGEEVFTERRVRLDGETRPALFNRADGGVHPVNLMAALRDSSPGVEFAFGVNARHVADGQAELDTAAGRRRVTCDGAVICTNGFARDLDSASGVVPGRGQVIVTSPVRTETDRALGYLRDGYDYFRFVDGRLLIGGGRDLFKDEQGADDPTPTMGVRRHLEETAVKVLGHDEFNVEHHWAGVMGFVGGVHLGGSLRRRIDDRTEALAGFGGMGVALTPLYASQVAKDW